MADDIVAAAHAETSQAEAEGIDAAVDHDVPSSDPVIQPANDALLSRRHALRELG